MTLVIENYWHDLRSGACIRTRDGLCSSKSSYPSVRAMQRELLRRNRASIRSGPCCAALTSEGVVFYYLDSAYGYRTVQHVRLIP